VAIAYFYNNEKKTRTKVGYPFNANVIGLEHSSFVAI
jgi:hypothetical protein